MVSWQSRQSIVELYFPEIKFCSQVTDEQALRNTSTCIEEKESKENSYHGDAVQNSGSMVRSCDPCLNMCWLCFHFYKLSIWVQPSSLPFSLLFSNKQAQKVDK